MSWGPIEQIDHLIQNIDVFLEKEYHKDPPYTEQFMEGTIQSLIHLRNHVQSGSKVEIHVSGGVAEVVSASPWINVEVLDFDVCPGCGGTGVLLDDTVCPECGGTSRHRGV